ncbi:hypothetical protein RJ640_004660 [Escallonia rubra]|uniref:TOG domain-containing protein n=1 Tax=Escallonia rubra TaxID=112253 RepID=A0AA88S9I7_9ASTE|nr:hypothetical protein RJ640_004660 [Escallonia rubra]
MATQAPKSSRNSKPNTNQSTFSTATPPSRSSSSSLSSHLAMVELKQRILNSLSKLSDRDTHQIAVEDLEKIVQALSQDGVVMLLNCLYDATNDPKPAVKKEAIRLLAATCAAHGDSTATHLTKIIAHIVKRLKDSDSGVKDSCKDAIGALSSLYLKGEVENGGLGSVVSLFVKPLFEAMGEQNKGVQAGAALCMAKMIECAPDPPASAFQKLCPKICKYLNNPNFLAKAALLPVVASLSQVGAIAPQSLEPLLQSIHECLGSTDWATRKAAADVLNALALHSRNLIAGRADSTLTVLEASRFDKIKPVRDSVTDALQLWKNVAGKGGDGSSDDRKTVSHDGENSEPAELSNSRERRTETSAKDSSSTSPTDSLSKPKGSNVLDKAVGIMKKKAPALTDKEINPEFFQKLEARGLGDSVEVVVAHRSVKSSNSHNEEESEQNCTDSRGRLKGRDDGSVNFKYRNIERGDKDSAFLRQRDYDDRGDLNQRESSAIRAEFSRSDVQPEGFLNNKGNWLAIQRQLLQLERQQTHLLNMLQDFMGGSHDGMITLENRVRGLERVVEDMARDLSLSTGRRGSSYAMGFEESSSRSLGKYNGFADYSSTKRGRGGDGRNPYGERFASSDGIVSSMRGRGPSWRSDAPESWDFRTYGRNALSGSRRALGGAPMDVRSPKSEYESDQVGSRRAWDQGAGPVRFGEGPSARSVWQASKDEATLEAIRVAGEDNGTARTARVAIPELTAEAMGDDNVVQDRDPVWTSWSNAMDAIQVGDMDSAFAEVLSTGDDLLLVKLMDRSGPVVDHLSREVMSEVLHAVAQFLSEQNLFDICLSWIQQLVDMAIENETDVLGIPMEVKREMLLNLNEACSSFDPPEDWEGVAPDQLLLQLASVWEIDLQQLEK